MSVNASLYLEKNDYYNYFKTMISDAIAASHQNFSLESKISLIIINEFKLIFSNKCLFKKASKIIIKFLKNPEDICKDYLSKTSKYIIIRHYISCYLISSYSLPYVDFYTDLHDIQTSNIIRNKDLLDLSLTKENFDIIKNKIIRLGSLNYKYFKEYNIISEDSVLKDELINTFIEFNQKKTPVINIDMIADYFYLQSEDHLIKNFSFLYFNQFRKHIHNEYYRNNYCYFIKKEPSIYSDNVESVIDIIQSVILKMNNNEILLSNRSELKIIDKKTIALFESLVNYLINSYFQGKVSKEFINDIFYFLNRYSLVENNSHYFTACFCALHANNTVKKIYILKNILIPNLIYIHKGSLLINELDFYDKKYKDQIIKIEIKMYFILLTRLITKAVLSDSDKKNFQNIISKNQIVKEVFLADQRKEISSKKSLLEGDGYKLKKRL